MSEDVKQNGEAMEILAVPPSGTEETVVIQSAEQAIESFARRLRVMKAVENLALKQTTYRDWTDQGGKPYLLHSGAEKIARGLGLTIRLISKEKTWSEDEVGRFYIYIYTVEISHPQLGSMTAIGSCSQRDQFFAKVGKEWKPLSEIDEVSIMKAAYTNAVVNAITHFLGIRNLTWEEVNEALGDQAKKILKINYKRKSTKKKEKKEHKREDVEAWIEKMAKDLYGPDEKISEAVRNEEDMQKVWETYHSLKKQWKEKKEAGELFSQQE